MNKELKERIIRVDHAGEYGAKRIYQGQIAFTKNEKTRALLQEMLEHEKEHLDYFENEIKKQQLRPTIFQPMWHVAGYALGAITAIMGEKAAMACTYAVEDVIEDHYQQQIDKLKNEDSELKEKIIKFQAEEVHHKEIAIEYNAQEAPFFSALDKTIRTGSKMAIWLSERF